MTGTFRRTQEFWCTYSSHQIKKAFHILRLTADNSVCVDSFKKGRVCVCPLKLCHKGLIWFYQDDS